MPSFSNSEALEKYIREAINDTIRDELTEVVKSEWLYEQEKRVYDTYKPRQYERRGKHGGLADPLNITSKQQTLSPTSTLFTLTNITEGATDRVGQQINTFIETIGNVNGATPYTERTVSNLKTVASNSVKGALVDGLRSKGINITIN